mgnify:FL=1
MVNMSIKNNFNISNSNKHYLIFAGTTEGRMLIEQLLTSPNIQITACTATEYGKVLLPSSDRLTISSKRLDEQQMISLMQNNNFNAVIDTTHPYAVIVSENIKKSADITGIPYIRLLRPKQMINDLENVKFVSSIEEAISYLSSTTENILSTIGSKELAKLCEISDYKERIFARILPLPDMVKQCFDMGFTGKHLICMQGPFSEELNTALIHQFNIKYTLTKDSGKLGGFIEKVNSAKNTNTILVVIGRPKVEQGFSYDEVIKMLL